MQFLGKLGVLLYVVNMGPVMKLQISAINVSLSVYAQTIVFLSNHVDNKFTFYYFCVSQKTKNKNKTYELKEIESKLQAEKRRNELLQEQIDLMKEQLIGSSAAYYVGMDVSTILKAHGLFLLIYFCFQ
jgi:hypothetical protein